MVKRISSIIGIVCILILGITLFSQKTDMEFAKSGNIICITDDLCINDPLSETDLNTIIEIFDQKILYRDSPSCGFSENIAIRINDKDIFCVARDGCPIVYWTSKKCSFD